jgi:hypothetical protein
MRLLLVGTVYFAALPFGFAILFGGLVAFFASTNSNVSPHTASLLGFIFGAALFTAAIGSRWLRGNWPHEP